MKQGGVLDHEYRAHGGCNLKDDCPAKGEKLLKVIKLDLNASGDCEGEEVDLKGDWCDLCLKMGPTSVVEFTCSNEKCDNHGEGEEFPFKLCNNCGEHGSVKCPYSEPQWKWKYPGDHIFERVYEKGTTNAEESTDDKTLSAKKLRENPRRGHCQIL